jgi:hypothetical protein
VTNPLLSETGEYWCGSTRWRGVGRRVELGKTHKGIPVVFWCEPWERVYSSGRLLFRRRSYLRQVNWPTTGCWTDETRERWVIVQGWYKEAA